ncbi:methylmalonyl Co-A mutase-associated GTPase MeaB [Cytophagaceae bacterium ABcell3]|nr:methylmalonyl Co-A mutase-associated GTPase MeaB [Cytophagaceae bacterium ABcell3]
MATGTLKIRRRLSVEEYCEGIIKGNRRTLSKALTLAESQKQEDRQLFQEVLQKVMPYTGKSLRIGITGLPGAGKSTLIENAGTMLIGQGHQVAVLAVDPSSAVTGGSILGDKTRMSQLSSMPQAFIRPSPSGHSLGGIAAKTRESILLCEAAGFDIIIVETVGIGQTGAEVYNMTDIFLLMLLTGAGDELQAVKKGISELADIIVINKADGNNEEKAQQMKKSLEQIFDQTNKHGNKNILLHSSLKSNRTEHLLDAISNMQKHKMRSGQFLQKRKTQNLDWMHAEINKLLIQDFYESNIYQSASENYEKQVIEGSCPPALAAKKLLEVYRKGINNF